MNTTPPLIAVLNTDEGVLNTLANWFRTHGFRAVCANIRDLAHGHEDVAAFLERHHPSTLLVDVGTPYGPNWDFVVALRMIDETSAVPLLVTTGNKTELERAVGPTDAMELTGTPENLVVVTAAVRALVSE